MKTIYKYPLTSNKLSLELPKDAKILSVQSQNEQTCIWVELDINHSSTEKRHFVIYGTGDFFIEESNHKFIGTIQLQEGAFVFHVYEIIN